MRRSEEVQLWFSLLRYFFFPCKLLAESVTKHMSYGYPRTLSPLLSPFLSLSEPS